MCLSRLWKKQRITCPYCFETFAPEAVCFLVPAAEEENATAHYYYDPSDSTAAENAQSGSEAESGSGDLELFRRRPGDKKLEDFWKGIGGASAYQENLAYPGNIQWNSPLVTPENQAQKTMHGYERDADGFVNAVHDRLSGAESRVRLCPSCHNTLPEGYGKYETKFFAVVGITYAGKTVYLRQLLGAIDRYLQKADLTVEYRDEEARQFAPIEDARDVLPSATVSDMFRRPITFAVAEQATGKRHTLVFYDISGENCVDPKKMRLYGPYLEHADAILLLLDPSQFRVLRGKLRKEPQNRADSSFSSVESASAVLQAMKQNFLSLHDRLDKKNRVKTPIAFTLSKSDLLDNILNQDPLFRDCILTSSEELELGYSDKKKRHLVDYAQITRISGECDMLLRRNGEKSFCEDVAENYACRQLFAVSALGCATNTVLTNRPTDTGEYLRNSLRGRYYFDGAIPGEVVIELETGTEHRADNRLLLEEIVDRKGEKVLCYDLRDRTLSLAAGQPGGERGKFYFRVDAQGTVPRYTEYYLDYSGVAQEGASLRFAQVPASAVSPRRVEEPLLWLLAETGLVPKYNRG